MPDSSDDVAEGNLLRHLLGLPGADELERAFEEGLRLLAEATSASAAYLEVESEAGQFHSAYGDAETVGRGVIAHGFVNGTTIHSASARQDPRFRNLESVRRHAIEAIVCAPFESQHPPLMGAVYIQRNGVPGAFSERQRALVVLFAQPGDTQVPRAPGSRRARPYEREHRPYGARAPHLAHLRLSPVSAREAPPTRLSARCGESDVRDDTCRIVRQGHVAKLFPLKTCDRGWCRGARVSLSFFARSP
jgi:hypothetical protein